MYAYMHTYMDSSQVLPTILFKQCFFSLLLGWLCNVFPTKAAESISGMLILFN
jgi:hypothetical protein